MKRKIKLLGLSSLTLILLAACGRSEVTASSTNGWDQIVYFFAEAIQWLSINGQIGVGIVLFTIIIRAIMMPLYNMQIKSGQKMQDLQPELKKLQEKYPGRDTDSRMNLTEESQALYKEYGVNPYATMLPLVVQLPILMALYQALTRVAFLKTGTFLWIELSKPDPYFILPVLAALFTFLSSWLTNKAAREKNIAMTVMTYVMPIMIFFMSFRLASGVVLYWSVSYAFQVFQILLLNNPFKIIVKRLEEEQAEKERAAKIRRAKKKAQKRRK
ncbi:YidC/Oxa1 family membrane protein insertase [Streptococcus macedonicus]|uniref:Membrane protein insertase YidC n=1 Tax=Streptococcus macedonicus TaxID=59310 RepID=A0AA47IM27_STRMC|nr:YidC/Oxa1 family membrane protein insertase [Streptococcus macedonicus]MBT1048748.1 membrane protein insertase YidC [Streptococcus macedonicus]MCW8486747.1 YidC/Oxa1 family membrane protein insertase [Streptococcus macedonicus]MCW8494934.1 YidC/Oxa1 family membrane protein insertase [Streptococcus macedonicus]MCW8500214.1 YidC/Oxa1 family membrane protein insertase [Streptococcus macedonicus]MCW8502283.1 YidC/Oxa1 family membrane protein insertase [Streptococcus macedonicus]